MDAVISLGQLCFAYFKKKKSLTGLSKGRLLQFTINFFQAETQLFQEIYTPADLGRMYLGYFQNLVTCQPQAQTLKELLFMGILSKFPTCHVHTVMKFCRPVYCIRSTWITIIARRLPSRSIVPCVKKVFSPRLASDIIWKLTRASSLFVWFVMPGLITSIT